MENSRKQYLLTLKLFRIMKKTLIFVFICFILSLPAIASPINVTYDDGIYHIILSGNKIKKKIFNKQKEK